jgi:hypothetical protein
MNYDFFFGCLFGVFGVRPMCRWLDKVAREISEELERRKDP